MPNESGRPQNVLTLLHGLVRALKYVYLVRLLSFSFLDRFGSLRLVRSFEYVVGKRLPRNGLDLFPLGMTVDGGAAAGRTETLNDRLMT